MSHKNIETIIESHLRSLQKHGYSHWMVKV